MLCNQRVVRLGAYNKTYLSICFVQYQIICYFVNLRRIAWLMSTAFCDYSVFRHSVIIGSHSPASDLTPEPCGEPFYQKIGRCIHTAISTTLSVHKTSPATCLEHSLVLPSDQHGVFGHVFQNSHDLCVCMMIFCLHFQSYLLNSIYSIIV